MSDPTTTAIVKYEPEQIEARDLTLTLGPDKRFRFPGFCEAFYRTASREELAAHMESHGIKLIVPTLEYLPSRSELQQMIIQMEERCSTVATFKMSEVMHWYNIINLELVSGLAKWFTPRMKGGARIVEICAGNGLLSHWLTKMGIPVIATDKDTSAENYWTKTNYSDRVECLDAMSAMKKYRPKFVIASWVPLHDDLAVEVLNFPSVKNLVWIGEGNGGCCGGDKIWSYPSRELNEASDNVVSRTDYFMHGAFGFCRHGMCVAFRKKMRIR